MKTRLPIIGALIVGVSFLAACGGGGNAGPPAVVLVPCALPTGTLVALAYPEPGATAVPTNAGQVVLAVSSPLPNNWQVVLQLPYGDFFEAVLNPIAPSSIPTPYAVPTFASPTYQSSGLTGPLPAGTLIEVLLNNEASDCNEFSPVGSFTTQ
jgi:hypothetical protein